MKFARLSVLAISGLFAAESHAASSVNIGFGSAADYDNNFYETTNATSAGWQSSNNTLEKGFGLPNSATTMIYNSTSNGTGGNGGTTAATLNNDVFNNFAIKMDFASSGLDAGGNSLGFFAKVNSAGTSGYAAIFRITSSTTADFRVWDSDSNPNSGALGTQIYTQTITGNFTAGTFYTFQLAVQDVGSNVQFTGSIFAAGGGAQIGSSASYTDTTGALLGNGQVGLRLGTNTTASNYYDNFNINPIPEPASAALLGFGGLMLGLRRKRK